MPKKTSPLDTLALSALYVAEAQGWPCDMAALAAHAGIDMATLRVLAPGRGAVLCAIVRFIDTQTLSRLEAPNMNTPPRERLFEVFMERFEVMEAHRSGLMAIMAALPRDPAGATALMLAVKRSMAWMLHAAGVPTRAGTLTGTLIRGGALAVYLKALAAWHGDSGPDLPRTMAALDSALAQAERAAWILNPSA